MSTCEHDGCPNQARWQVYAAHDEDALAVHPLVARYPAPMVRSCDDHLTWEMCRDAASFASTLQWVVKPL